MLMPAVSALIDLALEEDLGRGDVTSWSVLEGDDEPVSAVIIARQDVVVCGVEVAAEVFRRVDADLALDSVVRDGERVREGDHVMRIAGPARTLLAAERTALNFLQRLCGIATFSRRFAESVEGTGAVVVDTRKTTPGWRALEKQAVAAGGCGNHRADLGSGILIKDNHIAAAGGVTKALERARARAPHPFRIEIEVEDHGGLQAALEAGADIVLLDNMAVDEVEDCARIAHERGVLVEVSGGVTLDTVRAYAEAGADYISVGALTHSAPAADLSLEVES